MLSKRPFRAGCGEGPDGLDATRYRGARARPAAGTDDRADAAPGPSGTVSPAGPANSASPARGLVGRLLIAVVPALLGLITGGYHLGRVPLWRDEAATKAIASRRVVQILATMPHDDLVHGAYYLVVHYVIRLLGSSNHALRLPSVLAMAVACAFTALVAERLASAAGRGGAALTGLTAGVIFALLPATIAYAQEARSYALVTMMATIATYLLLRALDDGRPGWWAGYGAAVFLAALFNLFGLLILVAHGLTLLALARPTTARHWVRRRLGAPLGWVAASAVAVTLLIPVVIIAYGQRTSLSWISSPSLSREASALARLWAGSAGLVWPVFGLAALGVAASVIADRRAPGPATVALPWLAAPPAILITFSALHPIYDQRYVEFCLPGLAICVASGIGWLWRLAGVALGRAGAGRGPGRLTWLAFLPALAAAVALVVALLPADAVVRSSSYQPDNLEREAGIIAANARPGDIVFFIPINDRIVSMPFPSSWRKLRDIALETSPVASDTLYGTDVGPAALLRRFTHVTRVWVISSADDPEAAYLATTEPTALDREEYRLVGAMRRIHRWRDGDTELTLYAAR
jgi:mannosyltransferase